MREAVNLLIEHMTQEQLEGAFEKLDQEIGVLGMGREDDWLRKVEELVWVRDRLEDEIAVQEVMDDI